ncbi:MAG: hypothetical protein JXP72_00010 [Coriobacteriia bacterium]|nr:hypothetical protein [Coriobacteriia bacterium]
MGWVYVVGALELVAVPFAVVDIIALRKGVARSLPLVALGMKIAVILAYAVWWLYFNVITSAQSMEDLAVFAGILVVSVPVLIVSAVLDIMIVRALLRARKGV